MDDGEKTKWGDGMLSGVVLTRRRSIAKDGKEVVDPKEQDQKLRLYNKALAELDKVKQSEKARMTGLFDAKARKAAAMEWTVGLAAKKWEQDAEKTIRIGEMAEILWAAIVDTVHQNERPEKQETLRDWIRPVAPTYAKKGGRPKKPKK